MIDDLDPGVVAVCTAYAELRCGARLQPTGPYRAALAAAAYELLVMAPGRAGPHLDTIKRILEIDTKITRSSIVLWRASIAGLERESC